MMEQEKATNQGEFITRAKILELLGLSSQNDEEKDNNAILAKVKNIEEQYKNCVGTFENANKDEVEKFLSTWEKLNGVITYPGKINTATKESFDKGINTIIDQKAMDKKIVNELKDMIKLRVLFNLDLRNLTEENKKEGEIEKVQEKLKKIKENEKWRKKVTPEKMKEAFQLIEKAKKSKGGGVTGFPENHPASRTDTYYGMLHSRHKVTWILYQDESGVSHYMATFNPRDTLAFEKSLNELIDRGETTIKATNISKEMIQRGIEICLRRNVTFEYEGKKKEDVLMSSKPYEGIENIPEWLDNIEKKQEEEKKAEEKQKTEGRIKGKIKKFWLGWFGEGNIKEKLIQKIIGKDEDTLAKAWSDSVSAEDKKKGTIQKIYSLLTNAQIKKLEDRYSKETAEIRKKLKDFEGKEDNYSKGETRIAKNRLEKMKIEYLYFAAGSSKSAKNFEEKIKKITDEGKEKIDEKVLHKACEIFNDSPAKKKDLIDEGMIKGNYGETKKGAVEVQEIKNI